MFIGVLKMLQSFRDFLNESYSDEKELDEKVQIDEFTKKLS